MTLIIAFILMSMVNAGWWWYPPVFIIWCIHCMLAYGERKIVTKHKF